MKAIGDNKQCSKCRRILQIGDFRRDRARADGLHPWCKDCERAYSQGRADQISAYQKQYRQENIERLTENHRRWVENNREKLTEKKREYARRPGVIARMKEVRRRHYEEHKEAYRQNTAQWRANNADKVRSYGKKWKEQNQEQVKQSRARYNRENHETVIAWTQRRRARLKGAAVEDVDYKRILKRERSTCYLCGRKVDKSELHYDHVVPLSRGGTHSEDNIRVTHARCNLIKGTKLVEELDPQQFR